jgi:hypothetical protein
MNTLLRDAVFIRKALHALAICMLGFDDFVALCQLFSFIRARIDRLGIMNIQSLDQAANCPLDINHEDSAVYGTDVEARMEHKSLVPLMDGRFSFFPLNHPTDHRHHTFPCVTRGSDPLTISAGNPQSAVCPSHRRCIQTACAPLDAGLDHGSFPTSR